MEALVTRRTLLTLLVLLAYLSACSSDSSPAPRVPDGTTPEGLWLMVMNDCDGDCEEPGLGMGGQFYHLLSCEPVDEAYLSEAIAVADPASDITVPYEMARPIVGIAAEQAVAVGPESPSACDDLDRRGWFVARSQDYLYSDELSQQLAILTPNG